MESKSQNPIVPTQQVQKDKDTPSLGTILLAVVMGTSFEFICTVITIIIGEAIVEGTTHLLSIAHVFKKFVDFCQNIDQIVVLVAPYIGLTALICFAFVHRGIKNGKRNPWLNGLIGSFVGGFMAMPLLAIIWLVLLLLFIMGNCTGPSIACR